MDLDSGLVGKVVMGVVRHFATVWGASLVTQGLVTQDQDNKLIGALMIIVPIAFSILDKVQAHNAQKAKG